MLIFVTGPSGSGKTFLVELVNSIKPGEPDRNFKKKFPLGKAVDLDGFGYRVNPDDPKEWQCPIEVIDAFKPASDFGRRSFILCGTSSNQDEWVSTCQRLLIPIIEIRPSALELSSFRRKRGDSPEKVSSAASDSTVPHIPGATVVTSARGAYEAIEAYQRSAGNPVTF
jgi:energy-coupling factor transporter ATP-binding protein EcfA2